MPATSIKQQQAMGIARGIQKGEIKPKKGTTSAKIAKTMKPKDVKDFASTEHEGLPKKVKKENADGAVDTLYMVKVPFDGCSANSLVAPINPLQGSEHPHDQVHGVYPDQDQAQKVADGLYEDHCARMEALEEKKNDVADKITKAIEEFEKKRKEHVDAAKADPKNAGQHKQHIAQFATKIDDLMSKLEKVEKSKKPTKDKEEKEVVKEETEPKAANSTTGLAKAFRQYAQDLTTTSGISPKEIQGIEKLVKTILSKASAAEIGIAIEKAQLALDNGTKNVGQKPAIPALKATGKPTIPPVPPLPTKKATTGKPPIPPLPSKK